MEKPVIKSIIDGLLNVVCYIFLTMLATSRFIYSESSVDVALIVASINGILMAFVSFAFLKKVNSAKSIIAFYSLSFFVFVIGVILHFVCLLSFAFDIPFQREMSNADGFIIFFIVGVYFAVNFLFRFSIFIALMVRRIKSLN